MSAQGVLYVAGRKKRRESEQLTYRPIPEMGARLCVREAEKPSPCGKGYPKELRRRCPETKAHELAQGFTLMVRGQRTGCLELWLEGLKPILGALLRHWQGSDFRVT